MPPAHQFVEFLLQGTRHGTGFTVADRPEIDFPQRNDLRRRSAHEDFVGDST